MTSPARFSASYLYQFHGHEQLSLNDELEKRHWSGFTVITFVPTLVPVIPNFQGPHSSTQG